MWAMHGGLILVIGLVGFVAFFGFQLLLGAVALVVAVVLVLLSPLLRRRSVLGTRRKAEIDGLRRFLRDFSRLDELPIGHLALYERYLVYAVALGVADELVAGLRMRVPEVNDPNMGFATWYAVGHFGGYGHSAGPAFDGLGSIGSFASGLSSNFSSAFSPPSSASGGGGGFSGGGGGGGGGGGAGAH
jgi:uncharacterized membrane protein